MRASFAEPTETPELPVGRLTPATLQRLSSARLVHHRAGPWVACSEDFSRVLSAGLEVRRPGSSDGTLRLPLERTKQSAAIA